MDFNFIIGPCAVGKTTLAKELYKHYEKGCRNIVVLDFDDVRTRELPAIFKVYRFITLKLVYGAKRGDL